MKKLFVALTLLEILTGCASSAPAQTTAQTASTTASSAYEQVLEQAEQMKALRAESVHKEAEMLLKRGLNGIDSMENEVSRNDDMIEAFVWMENGAAICEIANNTDDMRDAWVTLRNSLIQIVDGATGYADGADFPVHINLYFVDENDHDKHLITISDGVCTQDASGIAP